jgi:hypothetical protein
LLDYLTKQIFNFVDASENFMASESILKKYGKYFQYLPLEERMIELVKKGDIENAMLLFEKEKPSEFVYKGDAIERQLRNIYLSTRLGVK